MIWQKIKPYFSLIRFFNQFGTVFLFLPCFYGLVYAANFAFFNVLLFGVGSFLARSCGCILNDIADKKIDAQIPTTENRVLALGVVPVKNALILFAMLAICGLPLLWFFSVHIIVPLVIIGLLVVLYPYCKRFFALPQLILGLVYASGFLIAVVHANNMPIWEVLHLPLGLRAVFIYFALVLWVVFYDTIYAKRDFTHDQKLGINSATVFFEEKYGVVFFVVFLVFVSLALALNVYAWAGMCAALVCAISVNYRLTNNASEMKINNILLFIAGISNGILLYGQNFVGICLILCAFCVQIYSLFLPAGKGFKVNALCVVFIAWCL